MGLSASSIQLSSPRVYVTWSRSYSPVLQNHAMRRCSSARGGLFVDSIAPNRDGLRVPDPSDLHECPFAAFLSACLSSIILIRFERWSRSEKVIGISIEVMVFNNRVVASQVPSNSMLNFRAKKRVTGKGEVGGRGGKDRNKDTDNTSLKRS